MPAPHHSEETDGEGRDAPPTESKESVSESNNIITEVKCVGLVSVVILVGFIK